MTPQSRALHWAMWPGLLLARLLGALLLLAAAAGLAGCSSGPPLENAPPLVEHRTGEDGASEDFVQLNTRPGARQGFLLDRVEQPRASLILFVGGNGRLGLQRARRPKKGQGGVPNFLLRTRFDFARHGFNVAVVDTPSDQHSLDAFRTSAAHAQDIQGVSAYLRQVAPVPVWVIGTSMGTISAANAAARLHEPGPQGLVLTSTITRANPRGSVYNTDLAAIRVPTLLVAHREDSCRVTPSVDVGVLARNLPHAPVVETRFFQGGDPPATEECEPGSPHGYWGIEAQVVDAISAWILAHPPTSSG